MRIVISAFGVIAFALVWFWLAIYSAYEGKPVMATLYSVPAAAVLLALLFPGKGPGYFALTHDFGIKKRVDESALSYELRMLVYWALGILVFPVGISISYFGIFEGEYKEFVSIAAPVVGLFVGVVCFLKSLGCIYRAVKIKFTSS